MLKKVLRGGRITGGGSLHHPDRGIESCDIELEIPGDLEAAERVIIRTLESVGAPRGSWIQVGERPVIPFGKAAGVKLALNGFRLPAKVYAENDALDLAMTLEQDLRGIARLQSFWEGPRYTEFYFYGEDEDRIRVILEGAADRFPLAQLSIVEIIA